MGEKLVVGPINKGLRTDREPFVIDNDSFPVIKNAYQWRGRVLRKRGTQLVGQLQRYIGSTDGSGNATIPISPTPIEEGISSFVIGTEVFYDPGTTSPIQILITNSAGSGPFTLNRSTGVLTITGSTQFSTPIIYFPCLPVMGLEETRLNPTVPPGTMGFDTTYSYIISQAEPFPIHDVSYYNNPATATYSSYVQKSTWTPTWWNGQNYQQFWTTNYAGALWATNGVTVPFSPENIGMQYAGPTTTPVLSSATWISPTQMQFTIVGNPLVVGDFVFANEFTGANTAGLNFQTGYVTTAGNTITVKFPNATIANATYTPGILQYLTNRSNTTLDCIRWFNGDPTNADIPPTFNTGFGWVNYMPPLSEGAYSIGGLPPSQYYLIGAKMILPFKDRLVFFGPVVQTSSPGSQAYLQDTIVFSQVGTPYYTSSYTNSPNPAKDTPTSANISFNAILVPNGQTATAPAMFEDQVGFGGFISAGIEDAITTIGANEDGLIIGFTRIQTRLLATGNDVTPFEFFTVNSELGSSSTFSSIIMDQGVITRGNRGYVISSQTGTQRIDLEILDQVFEVNLDNNGNERFTAQRDFINEWIYFTYPSNNYGTTNNNFPNETLFYNYRDNSYGIFYESYTTYGPFTINSGETWADLDYFTWSEWNDPWNAGDQLTNQPNIIAGNQQGFVFIRKDDETFEAPSLNIQNINSGVLTSPNHGLNNGDYITISGALGTIGPAVNGMVFQVSNATSTSFNLLPNPGSGTYLGGGYITRMYVPFIQTKQFPVAWNLGRKVRIGPQQYLLTTTSNGQITVQIYLSQDAASSYNDGPIVPQPESVNNSLIFSQIVYTCPESTNLGLTPANTNLQMLAYPGSSPNTGGNSPSSQIWHRMNTSLIGDTVQLAFTLNAQQMQDPNLVLQFDEIELHGFILDISPSMLLS